MNGNNHGLKVDYDYEARGNGWGNDRKNDRGDRKNDWGSERKNDWEKGEDDGWWNDWKTDNNWGGGRGGIRSKISPP